MANPGPLLATSTQSKPVRTHCFYTVSKITKGWLVVGVAQSGNDGGLFEPPPLQEHCILRYYAGFVNPRFRQGGALGCAGR
jgi:hypothetical protein